MGETFTPLGYRPTTSSQGRCGCCQTLANFRQPTVTEGGGPGTDKAPPNSRDIFAWQTQQPIHTHSVARALRRVLGAAVGGPRPWCWLGGGTWSARGGCTGGSFGPGERGASSCMAASRPLDSGGGGSAPPRRVRSRHRAPGSGPSLRGLPVTLQSNSPRRLAHRDPSCWGPGPPGSRVQPPLPGGSRWVSAEAETRRGFPQSEELLCELSLDTALGLERVCHP